MWCRQHAWLSTPEKDNGLIRREKIEQSGGKIEFPPLDDCEGALDLLSALMTAGPTEPGAMQELPLSWRTLQAWAELTEAGLSPGDFEAVSALSETYLAARDEYRGKSIPPPYDVVAINRKRLAQGIRDAFRAARSQI